MDARKIRKLRRRIEQLRRRKANVRRRELVSVARTLGWSSRDRGKEPAFEKPGRLPLTIPNHPGEMNPITADRILDRLEEDLFYEHRTSEEGASEEEVW
jgi:hypothetical protein